MSGASETRIWELARGALATKALGLAVELRVADALGDATLTVDDLARETAADPDSLHRVLRALASDGVFFEVEPRLFRNNEASDLLRRGHGWGEFAGLCGGVWYQTVGGLDATAGAPAFERAFGADFWTWLARHPEERTGFDRAMEQGKASRVERLAALEWRGDETVVDVGGGNGSLLAALLERKPHLRGVVFDLPETVRDERALGDRCTFVAGSFFEEVPQGDVYLLSTVLHDWDDDDAATILATIRQACDESARLVLLEAVVPPGNAAHGAKWLDLLLLALTGGRERDEAQWRALLEAASFTPVRVDDGLIEARCRSR